MAFETIVFLHCINWQKAIPIIYLRYTWRTLSFPHSFQHILAWYKSRSGRNRRINCSILRGAATNWSRCLQRGDIDKLVNPVNNYSGLGWAGVSSVSRLRYIATLSCVISFVIFDTWTRYIYNICQVATRHSRRSKVSYITAICIMSLSK